MIKNLLKEFISSRVRPKASESDGKEGDGFVPSEALWKQFLQFVGSDRITERQMEEVIAAMSRKDDMTFVKQMKEKIELNCDYAGDIRRKHPKITATELQICCYIVEGKSSKEIAKLMGVGTSTITANRSRLRTKLGIAHGRNLKVYLDSISRLKRRQR